MSRNRRKLDRAQFAGVVEERLIAEDNGFRAWGQHLVDAPYSWWNREGATRILEEPMGEGEFARGEWSTVVPRQARFQMPGHFHGAVRANLPVPVGNGRHLNCELRLDGSRGIKIG